MIDVIFRFRSIPLEPIDRIYQTLLACFLEYFSVSPVAVTNLSFCSDSFIAGL